MKQGRFNEEQTAGSLKEHEAGRKITERSRSTASLRRHPKAEATYLWGTSNESAEVQDVSSATFLFLFLSPFSLDNWFERE